MRNGSRPKRRANRRAARTTAEFERGSGNVFADIGLPDADVAHAKAVLVQRIRQLIEERNLNQSMAARLLAIDQPKVSALIRGRVEGYTIDRLFRFLNRLGQRVQIIVEPAANNPTAPAVVVA